MATLTQSVSTPTNISDSASCVVVRRHWSETIVDQVIARVNEEKRLSQSPKGLRELERRAKAKAKADDLRMKMFVALRTGYYNRLDADKKEADAEDEFKFAGNGQFN